VTGIVAHRPANGMPDLLSRMRSDEITHRFAELLALAIYSAQYLVLFKVLCCTASWTDLERSGTVPYRLGAAHA
jgi:hypothetical protein